MSTFNRPSNIPMSVQKLPPTSLQPSSLDSNSIHQQKNLPSNHFRSIIPTSTIKKNNNLNNRNLFHQQPPTSIKSASRINNGHRFIGFDSVQRSSNFGKNLYNTMTPQTKRVSYLKTPNSRLSTISKRKSSLSINNRQSVDNRPLSDQNYHRELADKILQFLIQNNYPQQITRQNLLRLSLSDASRLFQFLLSFFDEDIIIKNGTETSLNVVVSKQMQLLGYPYTIKNSDLTSFSGGRQLGSILSMLDFIIDNITYLQNVNVDSLIGYNLPLWANDNDNIDNEINMNYNDNDEYDDNNSIDISKIFPHIHEIVSKLDWNLLDDDDDDNEENAKKFNNEKSKQFKLFEKLYGNEEETSSLLKEVEECEKKKKKLDDELLYYNELPNKKEELINKIEDCNNYINDMNKQIEANKTIKNELQEKIKLNTNELNEIKNKNKNLEKLVDSQKNLIMDYQFAIERKKQLMIDIEQQENENAEIKKSITSITLDKKREHTNLQLLVNDFYEMFNSFCELYKKSLINKFINDKNNSNDNNNYNNLIINFDNDKEWLEFKNEFIKFKSYIKDDNNDNNNEMIKLFDSFKLIMLKKFKDLRMNLIEQSAILKTKISLNIMVKYQKQQKQCEEKKQLSKELEKKFQQLWKNKCDNEQFNDNNINELNDSIEQIKLNIFDQDKNLSLLNDNIKNLDDKIIEYERKIHDKKYQIMNDYKKKQQNYNEYEQRLKNEIDKDRSFIEKHNHNLQSIIDKFEKLY